MKEHSTAAQVVLVTLAALAAMLVGSGMFAIALAGVLGPIALVRFSLTTLGMQGGILARMLGAPMAALRMLASVAMFVGRALLANPIGLAITAIALGAYLIYQYWEPIKGFFSGLWDDIKSTFAAVAGWFGSLVSQFSGFGSNIITGLVNGITGGLGAVKDAVMNVASSTVGWFKEKLGIHSPSRVFGELGGFITQGAAIGMEAEQGRIAKAAVGIAALAATSFAAQAAGGPGVAFDARPALQARQAAANGANAAAGAASAAADQYVFQITGADPKEIANQVRLVLADIDRRKASRVSSRLSD